MTEPAGILGEIAAAKRVELASRFDGVSIDALRDRAQATRRSLAKQIAKPGASFILEIKKASPSAGSIRSDADAATIAKGYAGVADALSVLTDRHHFGGSANDLAAARRSFGGPILAKDFFIDRRQVAEARIAGADAILVMLSLLGDEEARGMIAEAKRFCMDSLVEVHDESEMRRALALGAAIIGINSRDLRDLTIDLSTVERIAPLAGDRVVVAESGINDRADVERLSGLVDGFLVGSALMRSENPAEAARELVFGRVKLCGLAGSDDLRAARSAAFAGFVFVPGTPRCLSEDEAGPLAALARAQGMLPVGVFRNAPVDTVGGLASRLDLHAVQLHGSETSQYVRDLRCKLGEAREIWTASEIGDAVPPSRGGDRTLFDNGPGATGQKFNWDLVRTHSELPSGIIAGGIGPHNARSAAALGAYALDVGSGVDERPRLKSPAKIHALFEALRHPSRVRLEECA